MSRGNWVLGRVGNPYHQLGAWGALKAHPVGSRVKPRALVHVGSGELCCSPTMQGCVYPADKLGILLLAEKNPFTP